MPRGKNSDAITAVVSRELKEKLKKYAASKHWSLSQAAAILIEEALEQADPEISLQKLAD